MTHSNQKLASLCPAHSKGQSPWRENCSCVIKAIWNTPGKGSNERCNFLIPYFTCKFL